MSLVLTLQWVLGAGSSIGALQFANLRVGEFKGLGMALFLSGVLGAGGTFALARIASALFLAIPDHSGGFNLGGALGLLVGGWLGLGLLPLLMIFLLTKTVVGERVSAASVLVAIVPCGGVAYLAGLVAAWVLDRHNPWEMAATLTLSSVINASVGLVVMMLMLKPAPPAAAESEALPEVMATRVNAGKPSHRVVMEIERLGGVYRWVSPLRPKMHEDWEVPEPIRSFLYDTHWPHVRFRGTLSGFEINWLQFVPMHLPAGSEQGAGLMRGGGALLVIRLDSPDPTDPLVFIRDTELQQDSEPVRLSELLSVLSWEERFLTAQWP